MKPMFAKYRIVPLMYSTSLKYQVDARGVLLNWYRVGEYTSLEQAKEVVREQVMLNHKKRKQGVIKYNDHGNVI